MAQTAAQRMARYRARRKARSKAERERLEALEGAAAALGKKLRTMARAPGDPPRDAHRQAWTEALDAWRDTFGSLMKVRRSGCWPLKGDAG